MAAGAEEIRRRFRKSKLLSRRARSKCQEPKTENAKVMYEQTVQPSFIQFNEKLVLRKGENARDKKITISRSFPGFRPFADPSDTCAHACRASPCGGVFPSSRGTWLFISNAGFRNPSAIANASRNPAPRRGPIAIDYDCVRPPTATKQESNTAPPLVEHVVTRRDTRAQLVSSLQRYVRHTD